MDNTSQVEQSTLSVLDDKLYRYFWIREWWDEDMRIIEPSITDVIRHFVSKFPIYRATFSTSVDWWTGGTITFKDSFFPDISKEYTTDYIHHWELINQPVATKEFIVWIAESVFWYWFEQEK